MYVKHKQVQRSETKNDTIKKLSQYLSHLEISESPSNKA